MGARPHSADDRFVLDRSLVHGVAWNGMVKLLVQAAAWGSTFVVGRLLSPDDYGVTGLATLFLGLIGARDRHCGGDATSPSRRCGS
jgi:hypothetical protein